jgi:uncharacterized protein YndB with AHSA1/START domain
VASARIHIDAPRQAVFDTLLDAWTYAEWVVGAAVIRAVDDDWPAPGSSFHHTVGIGPLKVSDRTEMVEHDEPRKVVLDARAGPAGRALVTFHIHQRKDGSTVEVEEHPVGGVAALLDNPVLEGGLLVRNEEMLRRLKRLVERRAGHSATETGHR